VSEKTTDHTVRSSYPSCRNEFDGLFALSEIVSAEMWRDPAPDAIADIVVLSISWHFFKLHHSRALDSKRCLKADFYWVVGG
jgi:hypothetical protein